MDNNAWLHYFCQFVYMFIFCTVCPLRLCFPCWDLCFNSVYVGRLVLRKGQAAMYSFWKKQHTVTQMYFFFLICFGMSAMFDALYFGSFFMKHWLRFYLLRYLRLIISCYFFRRVCDGCLFCSVQVYLQSAH